MTGTRNGSSSGGLSPKVVLTVLHCIARSSALCATRASHRRRLALIPNHAALLRVLPKPLQKTRRWLVFLSCLPSQLRLGRHQFAAERLSEDCLLDQLALARAGFQAVFNGG